MCQSFDEQSFVASLADADRCLMGSLTVSHGLEFAVAFRIEHADEVAKAMWAAAKRTSGLLSAGAVLSGEV